MQRKTRLIRKLLFCILILSTSFSVAAQTKKRKTPVKKSTVPAANQPSTPTVAVTPVPEAPKKNERPGVNTDTQGGKNAQAAAASETKLATLSYFYEFSQPNFVVSKIMIEHDDSGKGTLSFIKNNAESPISDPIEVAPDVLERINKALAALNFLDSNENYQYEKDYSHLGSINFRFSKDGRERNTSFNWTMNKNARALADEYRKIGNQFIWIFDISVARENQPLEAPKLLDHLESLIKRNEVSDARQLTPFLKGLTDDERIPLIARNHAGKIVKKIEKETK